MTSDAAHDAAGTAPRPTPAQAWLATARGEQMQALMDTTRQIWTVLSETFRRLAEDIGRIFKALAPLVRELESIDWDSPEMAWALAWRDAPYCHCLCSAHRTGVCAGEVHPVTAAVVRFPAGPVVMCPVCAADRRGLLVALIERCGQASLIPPCPRVRGRAGRRRVQPS